MVKPGEDGGVRRKKLIRDIEALCGFNVCTEEEERNCKEEIGEDEEAEKHWAWACRNCEKRKPMDIHPYACHLMNLYRLKMAGYPFEKNDLPYQTWLDLGLVAKILSVRFRGL